MKVKYRIWGHLKTGGAQRHGPGFNQAHTFNATVYQLSNIKLAKKLSETRGWQVNSTLHCLNIVSLRKHANTFKVRVKAN